MSPTDRPKSNNRRVLVPYSPAMRHLLATKRYNSGIRPSGHRVGKVSFLKNNRGAIPGNVIVASNTSSTDAYHRSCRASEALRHPATMPETLAEFFIRFLTTAGDIVLDPFAGSNTTGAVAERLGRRWIAVEPITNYIEGSRARFSRTSALTNRTFATRFPALIGS